MAIFRDNHGPRPFIVPDEHIDRLCIVAQREKVALRQELIVGNSFGKLKAIAFVLPKPYLIEHCGWQCGFGLNGVIIGEHLMENYGIIITLKLYRGIQNVRLDERVVPGS